MLEKHVTNGAASYERLYINFTYCARHRFDPAAYYNEFGTGANNNFSRNFKSISGGFLRLNLKPTAHRR